jgi:hypothetical protein
MCAPNRHATTAGAIHEKGTDEEVFSGNEPDVPWITAPLALKADKINNSEKEVIVFMVKGFKNAYNRKNLDPRTNKHKKFFYSFSDTDCFFVHFIYAFSIYVNDTAWWYCF